MPPGGAETQVLMLATALARRGLRVAIIAFGKRFELPTEVEGVRVVARPPYRRRRLIGKLTEAMQVLLALWRSPRGTIVYRGAGRDLALLAWYARLARRRSVFSSANVGDFRPRRLLAKRRDVFMYRYGARRVDAHVVQTEEQIELCRKAFDRNPILIRSLARVQQPQVDSPEAFLWVGRLVSYKQPLAYVALARAVPEAKFCMVGVPPTVDSEAPLADAVIAAARQLPNLELLAPRPHAAIGTLMDRAVASVNTADFEGMPNVLLEAWARGVPALVLTHDPDDVITTHGLGGFANGSPERLAALARELWVKRDNRDELSHRCRTYVAKEHAPDVVVEQWIGVLSNR